MIGFFGEFKFASFIICKLSFKTCFSFTRKFPCVCSSVGAEILLNSYKPYQDNDLSRHAYLCLKGANHLYKF